MEGSVLQVLQARGSDKRIVISGFQPTDKFFLIEINFNHPPKSHRAIDTMKRARQRAQ